ncbi:MAG: hypothetical protein ACI9A7_000974 [Cyclobacteriaceae bacterium]|jgi:hypothetical protein
MKYLANLLFFIPCALLGQINVTAEYIDKVYTLSDAGKAQIDISYKYTIHNDQGNWAGVFRDYFDDFRSINNFKFEVFDKTGKSINKINRREALEVSMFKSYETNDVKMLIADPDYYFYPYSVICSYSINLDGFVDLRDWSPVNNHDVFVKKSSLTVNYNENQPLLTYALNGMEQPSDECVNGQCSFSIVYNNLEPIVRQKYARSLRDVVPRLLMKTEKFQLDGEVGELSSWKSFGDWYLQLNKSEAKLSDKTVSDVRKIANSFIAPDKAIDSIYKFMQEKTRYVSIQLGIGGMRSLPVDLVDNKGYGDCKALTNYTQHLLREAGFDSYPVLVQAGEQYEELVEEFPSSQFNHIFLAVPMEQDTIWLECTSQQSPSDYLGTFTDGRKVLWLENGKSKIITTPKIKAEENLTKEIIRINLTKQGLAYCEIWQKKQGIHYDDASAYQYLDQEVIKKRNYEKFEFSDFTITDFTYAIKPDSLVLIENYTIDIPKFGKAYGGRLIVDLEEFSQTKTISSDSSDHYIKLRRGNSINQKIVIAIPEGLKIKYVAASMQIENEFGKYFYNVSQTEEEIVISKYYQLNSGTYEGEQFRQFKSFVNKVAETERAKILFVKKT